MKYHSSLPLHVFVSWKAEKEKEISDKEILSSIRRSEDKCKTFCNMLEVLELTKNLNSTNDVRGPGMRWKNMGLACDMHTFLEVYAGNDGEVVCTIYPDDRNQPNVVDTVVKLRDFSPSSIWSAYGSFRECPSPVLLSIANALNRCVKDFDKLKGMCIENRLFTEKEFDLEMVKRTISR